MYKPSYKLLDIWIHFVSLIMPKNSILRHHSLTKFEKLDPLIINVHTQLAIYYQNKTFP